MALLQLGSTCFQYWLLHCLVCCMIYVKTSMPMPIEHLNTGHEFLRAKPSHFWTPWQATAHSVSNFEGTICDSYFGLWLDWLKIFFVTHCSLKLATATFQRTFTCTPFKCLLYTVCGPGSSVGIETDYGLDGPGIESRWGRDFPHLSSPALGPTQPPVEWVPGLSRWWSTAGACCWPLTPF
jgi:hypothetical protein